MVIHGQKKQKKLSGEKVEKFRITVKTFGDGINVD